MIKSRNGFYVSTSKAINFTIGHVIQNIDKTDNIRIM